MMTTKVVTTIMQLQITAVTTIMQLQVKLEAGSIDPEMDTEAKTESESGNRIIHVVCVATNFDCSN
jgi:hypothetical protein